jgi:hypothetical protein
MQNSKLRMFIKTFFGSHLQHFFQQPLQPDSPPAVRTLCGSIHLPKAKQHGFGIPAIMKYGSATKCRTEEQKEVLSSHHSGRWTVTTH